MDRTHRLVPRKSDQWVQATEDEEALHVKGLVVYLHTKDQLHGGSYAAVNSLGLGTMEPAPHELTVPEHLFQELLTRSSPKVKERISLQREYERWYYGASEAYDPLPILKRYAEEAGRVRMDLQTEGTDILWYFQQKDVWWSMTQELSDLIEDYARQGVYYFSVDSDERDDLWYEYDLESLTQTRCTQPAGAASPWYARCRKIERRGRPAEAPDPLEALGKEAMDLAEPITPPAEVTLAWPDSVQEAYAAGRAAAAEAAAAASSSDAPVRPLAKRRVTPRPLGAAFKLLLAASVATAGESAAVHTIAVASLACAYGQGPEDLIVEVGGEFNYRMRFRSFLEKQAFKAAMWMLEQVFTLVEPNSDDLSSASLSSGSVTPDVIYIYR